MTAPTTPTSTPSDALVGWEEIQDIELVIVRRMREHAAGAHPSAFRGAGHEPAGLRDWQPGDRPSAIDWAQSTLTNFAPLVTREQEHESTARLVIVADTSLSTRCGAGGVPVATIIARTVGTLALAGALFRDQVGLVTLDGPHRRLAVRPRVGKSHAVHCLETYQAAVTTGRGGAGNAAGEDGSGSETGGSVSQAAGRGNWIAGSGSGPAGLTLRPAAATDSDVRTDADLSALLRRTSLVPVISDFLFDGAEVLLGELANLNARHDVFVVLIDAAYAFELPVAPAGWTEVCDVETGQAVLLSAGELRSLAAEVRVWQDTVADRAEELGLEVLRLGADAGRFHETVVDFLADRRMRRR
ncbi:MAG: DUF58 domain-containing protein [Acidobacteria bacterium]|nr:DUF58 domain-containing protein [Acidobacteriota bacterium]